MPRAIGWSPALLSSRGGVIARPRFGPRTLIPRTGALRLGDGGSRGSRFATRAPTLRSGKLDRPVQYRFFRRSNFLALRDQFVVRCRSPAGQLPCRIGSCMPLVALTTSALTWRNTLSSSMPGLRKASINAFA